MSEVGPHASAASRVTCVWDAKALLGESPLWWPERATLLFVDIHRPVVFAWPEVGAGRELAVPLALCALGLRRDGGLVGALHRGLALLTLEPSAVEVFARPEADEPGNRFNDGKCDPAGRFWVASMDDSERAATGAIWRVDAGHRVERLAGPRHVVGNGFGWSPDGETMYFTDSVERTIHACAFDPASGEVGARRVFARVAPDAGYPDGLCVDTQGGVWSAHWDGWRVTRYHADGSVDRVVPMPVPRPTSLAFGGAALDRLFVTSARTGLDSQQLAEAPLSGGLFELEVELRGLPVSRYAG